MDVAIIGGRLVPVEGDAIDHGTILISDGRVTAIGAAADISVPEGTTTIDANGRWVLPGFVETHAHIGVDEQGEGWAGKDYNETADPNAARLRAIDGINPADLGFVDALSGGVTTAVIKPGSGNPIGGQTVAIKTWGRTQEDMLLKEPCSVKSALGENPKRKPGDQAQLPITRMGVAAQIREAFRKAQDYRTRRDRAAEKGDPFERDLSLETLVKVLDGDLPWCQHVHRADDIATAIRLADEFGYRLVINHGTEAHLLADLIAERDIPVIIGPLFSTRTKVELRQRTIRAPGILDRAGVRIAITTDHPVVGIQYLVLQAIMAVREGLDRDAALRALTIEPARILALDDRVGALTPGRDADVVIWSGDPLDAMSRPLQVLVSGRPVYEFDARSGVGVAQNPYYRER
jgi:imidazolonepropionase-like amidohydrolase